MDSFENSGYPYKIPFHIEPEKALRHRSLEHNRNTPIFRLPPETLSNIFTFCVPFPTQKLRDESGWVLPRSRQKPLEWLAFTHVCCHWRAVAVNHSALWTCPDFTNPELAREMLIRSKQSLLDIFFEEPAERLQRKGLFILLEVLGHGYRRIRSLDLDLGPGDMVMATSLMGHSVPFLKSLRLKTGAYGAHTPLPDNLLGGVSPALTQITLRNCDLPWGSGILQNLTSLDLDGSMDHRPLSQEFYAVLNSSPRLRTLRIGTYAIPFKANMELPLVPLAHLKLISLTSDVPEETANCTDLLEHLSFPGNTAIHISLSAWGRSADPIVHSLQPLFNTLTQKFSDSRDGCPILKSVSLLGEDEEDEGVEMLLKAWRSADSPWEVGDSPRFSLSIDWASKFSFHWVEVARRALRILPSKSVKTLRFGFLPNHVQIDDVIGILGPYLHGESSGLRNLHVQSTASTNQVLNALFKASYGVQPQLAMSSLQSIFIKEIFVSDTVDFSLALMRYLAWRMKEQSKLDRLVLIDCYDDLQDSQINVLRALVNVLERVELEHEEM